MRQLLLSRPWVPFSCSAVYILRYRTLLAVTPHEVKAEPRISVCSTKTISRNDPAAETIHQAFYVVPILAHVDRMPSTAPDRAGTATGTALAVPVAEVLSVSRLSTGIHIILTEVIWSSSVALNQG